jgi:hypothetical protein
MVGDQLITDQEGKVSAFLEAYSELLGTIHTRDHGINLEALEIQALDLQELETLFS